MDSNTHTFMLHLVCDLLADPTKHHYHVHCSGDSASGGAFEDICIAHLVSDIVQRHVRHHSSSSRKRILNQLMSEWSKVRLENKQDEEYFCETFF